LGAAPLFADEGGSEDADSTTSDGPTILMAGADASHYTTTEVIVVAAAASDELPPTAGGTPPSPLPLRRWPQWRWRTPLRLITCAAPLRVMAPAPTSPEEDASKSSGIPAKGVTAVATSEGATTPVGTRPTRSPALHRGEWWHLHLRLGRMPPGHYVGVVGMREGLTSIPYSRRNVWRRKRTSKVCPFLAFQIHTLFQTLVGKPSTQIPRVSLV
jgi:hypothetical protein